MFRCQCGYLSAPKERPVKIVIETRPKDYYEEIRGRMHLVGVGREIVKEVMMCRECAEKHEN
jgi:hypothetical protein